MCGCAEIVKHSCLQQCDIQWTRTLARVILHNSNSLYVDIVHLEEFRFSCTVGRHFKQNWFLTKYQFPFARWHQVCLPLCLHTWGRGPEVMECPRVAPAARSSARIHSRLFCGRLLIAVWACLCVCERSAEEQWKQASPQASVIPTSCLPQSTFEGRKSELAHGLRAMW